MADPLVGYGAIAVVFNGGGGNFASQVGIWKYFSLSQLKGEGAVSNQCTQAWDAAKHSTTHRTLTPLPLPTLKNYPVPNVRSDKAEKPWDVRTCPENPCGT